MRGCFGDWIVQAGHRIGNIRPLVAEFSDAWITEACGGWQTVMHKGDRGPIPTGSSLLLVGCSPLLRPRNTLMRFSQRVLTKEI